MKSHYCYVKSLSALLRSQQQSNNHVHYCKRCLKGYSSEHVLDKHVEHCKGTPGRPTRIEMPERGKNTLKFQQFNRQAPVPWVMYFDFESIIRKHVTCINNLEISSTTKAAAHVPCGFSLIAVRSDGHYKGPFLYRGEDCIEVFLKTIQELESVIREELEEKKPITMTRNDWAAFNTARRCYICKKELVRCNERDEAEVWDRTTGEYCGKAHKYKRSPEFGQYTCFGFEWECRAKDEKGNLKEQRRPRNMATKKLYLEENPDEKDCIHCKESLVR